MKRRTIVITAGAVIAVLAVTLFALVLLGVLGRPSDSGIRGTVTIGPISPVEQPGQVNEAPYEATILVKNSCGLTVARVVSSAVDGTFSVNLAPGTYTLVPLGPGTLPYASVQEVTVVAHMYLEVTISYDSGIR